LASSNQHEEKQMTRLKVKSVVSLPVLVFGAGMMMSSGARADICDVPARALSSQQFQSFFTMVAARVRTLQVAGRVLRAKPDISPRSLALRARLEQAGSA
jgi:hypothetical protein